MREGSDLVYTVSAYDPDGDPVTLGVNGLENLRGSPQFDAATGTLTWTAHREPQDDAPTLEFTAADPRGGHGSAMTRIEVVDANSDPLWSPVPPQTAVEGHTLQVTVSVTDPDGGDPTVLLDPSGLPAASDAAYSPDLHLFSWTPTFRDGRAEPYTVRLLARD